MNKSILSISLDPNIAKPQYGDALIRQKEYAKYFDNYTVIILNTKKNRLKRELHFQNLHIYSLNSKNKYLYFFDSIRLIKKLNKVYHFDLVSSQDPLITGIIAYLTKLILKIPFNLQLHSSFCFDSNQKYNLFLTLLIKFIISKANSIRTVFPNLNIKNKNIKHIPVFTDLDFYSFKNKKKENISNFISVGRLEKEKNFALLIKAFQKALETNPYLTLNIVGDGSQKDNLKNIIKNKKVKILGYCSKQKIKKLYQESDVFILVSNYEGWGNVFLEAISSSLPIISTNVGFVKSNLKNNYSALISPIQNSTQLTKNILTISQDPQLAFKFSKNAKKELKNFTKQKLIKDWIDLLENTK